MFSSTARLAVRNITVRGSTSVTTLRQHATQMSVRAFATFYQKMAARDWKVRHTTHHSAHRQSLLQ